ncbi:MmcB family DNA repair protein [Parvibaculum sp.]|uniref:MmcB family DNA repair protein n=1 Tax=Parvibaculum sp. TaxID=2024848 RepID=UPI002C6938EF|nr:MmcB family DNA repair protein [Parvibaculum sp.]HUD50492.1 MmcB family DNA repair protein [Parvibaculum sp.]
MANFSDEIEDSFRLFDGRQSATAAAVQRGCGRLLAQMNYAALTELTLATGRRADIIALGPKGEIIIIEIKSSLTDYLTDAKWEDYLDFCDRFFFAVPPDFPREVIPLDVGLIIADKYDAEILREGEHDVQLPAARRKALTLQYARVAARRVFRFLDSE